MTIWPKLTTIVLVVLGIFLFLGGLRWDQNGDLVNVIPFWAQGLGFIMIVAGLYLYLLNLPQKMREKGLERFPLKKT